MRMSDGAKCNANKKNKNRIWELGVFQYKISHFRWLVEVSLIEKVTCEADLKEVRSESCWLKSYPVEGRQM